jgi:predicted amidohydrolase
MIGKVDSNLAKAVLFIRQAASSGAQLVVLPELTTTGYVFESREEAFSLAEDIPGGHSSVLFADLASELSVHIVIGMSERSGRNLFNTSALFSPDGFVGRFRKIHLWDQENLVFEPGDLGFPTFDTALGRIATMICYDSWFPESYRACALGGADLVCIPTNWVPIPGQDPAASAMATVLCMAAAHCNGIVIVAADRVGTERGQLFIGQSIIVSHTGWPLAGPASSDKEETLYANIDLAAARKSRTWNEFNNPLLNRRPDAYVPQVSASSP